MVPPLLCAFRIISDDFVRAKVAGLCDCYSVCVCVCWMGGESDSVNVRACVLEEWWSWGVGWWGPFRAKHTILLSSLSSFSTRSSLCDAITCSSRRSTPTVRWRAGGVQWGWSWRGYGDVSRDPEVFELPVFPHATLPVLINYISSVHCHSPSDSYLIRYCVDISRISNYTFASLNMKYLLHLHNNLLRTDRIESKITLLKNNMGTCKFSFFFNSPT